MPRLFPSILQGSNDAYTPLDGEEDEEEESTDGDTDGDKAP